MIFDETMERIRGSISERRHPATPDPLRLSDLHRDGGEGLLAFRPTAWQPRLFTTVLGITVSQMSLLLLLLVLGLAAGSVILGWIGDRIDRGRLLMLGAVITGTVMLPGVFVRDLWTAIPLLTVAGMARPRS